MSGSRGVLFPVSVLLILAGIVLLAIDTARPLAFGLLVLGALALPGSRWAVHERTKRAQVIRWSFRLVGAVITVIGAALLVFGETERQVTTDARFFGFFGGMFFLFSFFPSDEEDAHGPT